MYLYIMLYINLQGDGINRYFIVYVSYIILSLPPVVTSVKRCTLDLLYNVVRDQKCVYIDCGTPFLPHRTRGEERDAGATGQDGGAADGAAVNTERSSVPETHTTPCSHAGAHRHGETTG